MALVFRFWFPVISNFVFGLNLQSQASYRSAVCTVPGSTCYQHLSLMGRADATLRTSTYPSAAPLLSVFLSLGISVPLTHTGVIFF